VDPGAVLLAGCGGLDSIPYHPQTPETWLTIQPYVAIRIGSDGIILVQPNSTALAYLLGIAAIGAGLYFWRIGGRHRSRTWWGLALLL
jgi:hypothetical protein